MRRRWPQLRHVGQGPWFGRVRAENGGTVLLEERVLTADHASRSCGQGFSETWIPGRWNSEFRKCRSLLPLFSHSRWLRKRNGSVAWRLTWRFDPCESRPSLAQWIVEPTCLCVRSTPLNSIMFGVARSVLFTCGARVSTGLLPGRALLSWWVIPYGRQNMKTALYRCPRGSCRNVVLVIKSSVLWIHCFSHWGLWFLSWLWDEFSGSPPALKACDMSVPHLGGEG